MVSQFHSHATYLKIIQQGTIISKKHKDPSSEKHLYLRIALKSHLRQWDLSRCLILNVLI